MWDAVKLTSSVVVGALVVQGRRAVWFGGVVVRVGCVESTSLVYLKRVSLVR